MPNPRIKIVVTSTGQLDYQDENNNNANAKSVRAKRRDRVRWTSADGDFEVRFDAGSPFPQASYSGRKNQAVGDAVLDSANPNTYKYTATVTTSSGPVSEDPEIIVEL